ncbi:hypothetical protein Droror1_Dr00006434 [Drosera rotundifolia]
MIALSFSDNRFILIIHTLSLEVEFLFFSARTRYWDRRVVSFVSLHNDPGWDLLGVWSRDEYICNGSLDSHLYGRSVKLLNWSARQKIAVGAARGLRYLHECRVGCIVHRDMRPNNFLITHDFESLPSFRTLPSHKVIYA